MARTETWFKQNLQETVSTQYIRGNFFSLDNVGNLVGVRVYNGEAEETLTGSVTGYCILKDGTTVSVAGTRSGNTAYIILPQSALAIPGEIGIVIKLIDGSTITTLLSIAATVYRSRTDEVITPSSQIITDWSNQIAAAMQEVEDASALQDQKIADLKSALNGIGDSLDSLEQFTRKSITKDFSINKNVTAGSYSGSTKILDADIPQGQMYTLRVSITAGHGNIVFYEQHKDGTYKSLSSNLALDTDLTFTAEKDVSHFNMYTQNGFSSAGTVSVTAKYTVVTTGSIEERVDALETDLEDTVSKKNMENMDLVNVPASVNRIDPSKYLHGKKINYAYGQVTDSEKHALYYLDVIPGDTVYFWRYHNNSIISAYSDGIGVFDANGDFITRGGASGYQYSYTVPNNVYKLGLNFDENFLQLDEEYMAIFNNADNPGKFIPFRDNNNAYFSTETFLQRVDFNTLLPQSTKASWDEKIMSIGHAGGLSEYYPLNTELSIIGAKKAGFTAVEMDVQITQDGVYVIYHDTDMRRVGGTEEQTIANMTYAQLQQFDYGAWKSSDFAGTPLCTFDRAVCLCKLLGMKIFVDCKGIGTVDQFANANEIVKKWEMEDQTYWMASLFGNCWSAIPDAKIVFAAGGKLTGSDWTGEDGWFTNLPANYPDKCIEKDGIMVFRDDVYFGVCNNYNLINDQTYGLAGLKLESEKAKKYNIKYGLYAVDDVETIYQLCSGIPYMQYMEGNKIAIQNALNQYFGISMADYIFP